MTNLNQVTIGAVNSVARGAGNESLISLDMRFAVKAHTRRGQPEIGLGLVPGGGRSHTPHWNAHIEDIIPRLLLFPVEALGLIKQSVNVASRPQLSDTVGDADRFLQAASQSKAQALIVDLLQLTRNHSTGDVELYLGESVHLLYD
ncbi:hypothetical protein EK21DRAFT_102147 [Setomelanomma holmii]|uniref:Uncharacterized protein n=1 Tax=Setomelanomma holmii TaxID=210430 RepID=A0A9P4LK77_9PLEO|nr:hypothetical protein EK21DRAFT_102147 [Setomelanomma holmii]